MGRRHSLAFVMVVCQAIQMLIRVKEDCRACVNNSAVAFVNHSTQQRPFRSPIQQSSIAHCDQSNSQHDRGYAVMLQQQFMPLTCNAMIAWLSGMLKTFALILSLAQVAVRTELWTKPHGLLGEFDNIALWLDSMLILVLYIFALAFSMCVVSWALTGSAALHWLSAIALLYIRVQHCTYLIRTAHHCTHVIHTTHHCTYVCTTVHT